MSFRGRGGGGGRGKPGMPMRGGGRGGGSRGAPRGGGGRGGGGRGSGGPPRGGGRGSSRSSLAPAVPAAAFGFSADYGGDYGASDYAGYAGAGYGFEAGFDGGFDAGYGGHGGDMGYGGGGGGPRGRGGGGGAGSGGSSTHTRSTDPNSVNSRIFVGNLNTMMVTRDDLERIFSRFGAVQGISVHKGYAFIQYLAEQDARSAVAFTDHSVIGGKPVDVNMVAEPKQNKVAGGQNGAMRSPAAGGGGAGFAGTKRPRMDSTGFASGGGSALKTVPIDYGNTSSPQDGYKDTLICGCCKTIYHEWSQFTAHRKQSCVPRDQANKFEGEPEPLNCSSCPAQFGSSWQLLKHASDSHSITLWKLE